jgi:hypothetical protein
LKKSTLFFKRNLIIDFLTIIIKISFTHFFEHYPNESHLLFVESLMFFSNHTRSNCIWLGGGAGFHPVPGPGGGQGGNAGP